MIDDQEAAEVKRIFTRLQLLVIEANYVLRALAMGGNPVPVDTVERADSITGNEYTEVLIGIPGEFNEPGGEADLPEDPA
jgi:hypothetical protein